MDFSLPRYIFIAIISFFIPITGISQETSDHDHHNGEHDHAHQKNEISLAVGVVPLPEEDKITAGLHFTMLEVLHITIDLESGWL